MITLDFVQRFLSTTMDSRLIDLIAPHGEIEQRLPGNVLFTAGDPPSSIFVIESGTVRLTWSGRPARAEVVGASRVLALTDAIAGCPHDATAVAIEPCVVCRIDRDLFLDRFRSDPRAALQLVQALSDRVSSSYSRLRSSMR